MARAYVMMEQFQANAHHAEEAAKARKMRALLYDLHDKDLLDADSKDFKAEAKGKLKKAA